MTKLERLEAAYEAAWAASDAAWASYMESGAYAARGAYDAAYAASDVAWVAYSTEIKKLGETKC